MNVREAPEKVMYRQDRLPRSRTTAAPASVATTAENDARAGCRLRLAPHLERAKRRRRRKSSPRVTAPSAREAAWLLLRGGEPEDEGEQTAELLRRLSPEAGRARGLALRFVGLINELRRAYERASG